MSRHRRQQRKRARNFVGELPEFCFPARARETISDAERAMGEPPAQWVGVTMRDTFAMREAEREDS